MVEAPRVPTTGLTIPNTVTPTTPTQAPTPAPTPTDPVQVEREKISAQNKAQMELNAQKSQLAIQERKAQKEEERIASIPVDQKSIVQSLVAGVNVPPQNTPEYRNAQTIYSQFKKYNSMTDTELLSNLKQGNIGSELDSYLNQNPNYAKAKAKLAEQQKIDSLNRMGQSAFNVVTGTEPVDLADLTSVENKYKPPV